jgi:PTH1 family peptidyl-tRNA hydrolase
VHLVAGLGNPGPKYAGNRHNVGFMAVALLAERLGAAASRDGFEGRVTKTTHAGHDLVLLQPMTFMNRSGESVQAAMAFYKLSLGDVVVVHDELDLPFGEVRIKIGGGAAGHNGLRSITAQCGGNGFVRVRIGIGRPPSGRPEGWVLGDFGAEERAALPAVLDVAVGAVLGIVVEGAERTMNRLHTKKKPEVAG